MDGIKTRPFLFPAPLKTPISEAFLLDETALNSYSEATQLISSLKISRELLLKDISTTAVESSAYETSLQEYLSLVLSLLPKQQTDEVHGDLRDIGSYVWKSALSAPDSSQVGDILYDVCCCLLASSLWELRKAESLVEPSSGISTGGAVQASKHLQKSASSLALLRDHLLPMKRPSVHASTTVYDLDPELLNSLIKMSLAQAQGLSLLRAVEKGHQAHLIASIAVDTASIYSAAFWNLSNHVRGRSKGGGSADEYSSGQDLIQQQHDPSQWETSPMIIRQLGCFLRYQYSFCKAYAYTFSGLEKLKEMKAGIAVSPIDLVCASVEFIRDWHYKVRIISEASSLIKHADILGQEYDKAAAAASGQKLKKGASIPPSPARLAFHEAFAKEVSNALTKATKDNDQVFYQRVPEDLQEDVLPGGKRVVELLVIQLPQRKGSAKGLTELTAAMASMTASAAKELSSKAAVADSSEESKKPSATVVETEDIKVNMEGQAAHGGSPNDPPVTAPGDTGVTADSEHPVGGTTTTEDAGKVGTVQQVGTKPVEPAKKSSCPTEKLLMYMLAVQQMNW